jgi:hypothetical protein
MRSPLFRLAPVYLKFAGILWESDLTWKKKAPKTRCS